MYKNLITRSLIIGCLIVIGGCNPFSQQQQIDSLQKELDSFKADNSGVVVNAEQAEQQRLEAELAALKARQNNTNNTVVNNPVPNTVVNNPAPIIVNSPASKYGPGSSNNTQGPTEGYLTIHTNSANGKLTLRVNPSQSAQGLVEIPNGVSGIYYFNRVQVGDYVWYNAEYNGMNGWLRGDYLDTY